MVAEREGKKLHPANRIPIIMDATTTQKLFTI
jgi:hypothetical protein